VRRVGTGGGIALRRETIRPYHEEEFGIMLTRSSVLRLVGHNRLDDHTIVEIIGTGATEPELVEAVTRVSRGAEVGAEKRKPMSPKVAKLCEILMTSSIDVDESELP
jgi:hypothetical protein